MALTITHKIRLVGDTFTYLIPHNELQQAVITDKFGNNDDTIDITFVKPDFEIERDMKIRAQIEHNGVSLDVGEYNISSYNLDIKKGGLITLRGIRFIEEDSLVDAIIGRNGLLSIFPDGVDINDPAFAFVDTTEPSFFLHALHPYLFTRWQTLLGARSNIIYYIRDRILKSSSPNYRRILSELHNYNLTIFFGDAGPNYIKKVFDGQTISLVDYNFFHGNSAKPITRSMRIDYTNTYERVESILDVDNSAFERKMIFNHPDSVNSQSVRLFEEGGSLLPQIDLGEFDNIQEGVIAMEGRRIFLDSNVSTAQVTLPLDLSWRIRDVTEITLDRFRYNSYIVSSVKHTCGTNQNKTTLTLMKRSNPTDFDIYKSSPAPYNQQDISQEYLRGQVPSAPKLSISKDTEGNDVNTGSEFQIDIERPDRGLPLTGYRVEISQTNVGTPPTDRIEYDEIIEPRLTDFIYPLALASRAYAVRVYARNINGEGPPGVIAVISPTGKSPDVGIYEYPKRFDSTLAVINRTFELGDERTREKIANNLEHLFIGNHTTSIRGPVGGLIIGGGTFIALRYGGAFLLKSVIPLSKLSSAIMRFGLNLGDRGFRSSIFISRAITGGIGTSFRLGRILSPVARVAGRAGVVGSVLSVLWGLGNWFFSPSQDGIILIIAGDGYGYKLLDDQIQIDRRRTNNGRWGGWSNGIISYSSSFQFVNRGGGSGIQLIDANDTETQKIWSAFHAYSSSDTSEYVQYRVTIQSNAPSDNSVTLESKVLRLQDFIGARAEWMDREGNLIEANQPVYPEFSNPQTG